MATVATSDLPLRIVVDHPPPGIAFAVQIGQRGLLPPTEASRERLVFEFAIRVADLAPGKPPRLLGDATQGPPASRFVYVNSGQTAGQHGTPISRRAKVPLTSITPALIRAALKKPGARLEATMAGTGRDGGPTCASVTLAVDWHVAA